MAQAPPIPTGPIDILTNKGLIEEPFVNKFWGPALCGSLAFIGMCVSNWHTRRPMLSGIHRHIIFTGAAAALGKYIDEYRAGYLAERDAVLRHYIELHPDDFLPIERKKYANVFEPWLPIR